MERLFKLLYIAIAVVLVCNAQQKKRVAVMNFDYATVRSGMAAIFGTDMDVGKGIADLMVDRLVTSGVYSVIERKALDKILTEQNFSNSDRADAASAAKIARILGVDAIVIGSITQLEETIVHRCRWRRRGWHHAEFGIGGVSGRRPRPRRDQRPLGRHEHGGDPGGGHGKGESQRSGTPCSARAALRYRRRRRRRHAQQQLRCDDSGRGDHAGRGAAFATQMDQNAGKLPTNKVSVEGLVADATGGTLILNVGSRGGVKTGDRLEVRRKIRDIKDPATGKIIRSVEDKVGEVTITEVDAASSVGCLHRQLSGQSRGCGQERSVSSRGEREEGTHEFQYRGPHRRLRDRRECSAPAAWARSTRSATSFPTA